MQHLARIGQMLIEQQGDLSLRRFVAEAAERDRRLSRSTVHRYQQLHRHMGLLEQHEPASLNDAVRLITDANRPVVSVPCVGQQASPAVQASCLTVSPAVPAPTVPGSSNWDEWMAQRVAAARAQENDEYIDWVLRTVRSAPSMDDAAEVLEKLVGEPPHRAGERWPTDTRVRALVRYIHEHWEVEALEDEPSVRITTDEGVVLYLLAFPTQEDFNDVDA